MFSTTVEAKRTNLVNERSKGNKSILNRLKKNKKNTDFFIYLLVTTLTVIHSLIHSYVFCQFISLFLSLFIYSQMFVDVL